MSNVLISKNNYFNYEWIEQSYHLDLNIDLLLNIDFKTSCLNAAEEIYNTVNGLPITILLSGGIDSEFVARIFLEKKIPFTAKVIEFPNNENYFDIKLAYEFCESHNIKYEKISLDYKKWLNSNECFDLIEQYKFFEPFQLFDIKKWLLCNGDFAIFGLGDVFLQSHGDLHVSNDCSWDIKVYSLEDGAFTKAWDWQKINNVPGCYRFLKYTPEQYSSVILDNDVKQWADWAQYFSISNWRVFKLKWFQKFYPEIQARPKLNGYEEITEFYINYKKEHLEKNIPNKKYKAFEFYKLRDFFDDKCA